MSSSYGENLKLTIFGQSHSPAIGMTLEGLPAGTEIDMEALRAFLARRAPHPTAGPDSVLPSCAAVPAAACIPPLARPLASSCLGFLFCSRRSLPRTPSPTSWSSFPHPPPPTPRIDFQRGPGSAGLREGWARGRAGDGPCSPSPRLPPHPQLVSCAQQVGEERGEGGGGAPAGRLRASWRG